MAEDIEIHIKRRFNSPQTLCTENGASGMDGIHVHRALTLDEVLVAVRGSFPSERINNCNCLPCITAVQDLIACVLHLTSNRIRVLHENTLNAIDEQLLKATGEVLDKVSEKIDETQKTCENIIETMKEGL